MEPSNATMPALEGGQTNAVGNSGGLRRGWPLLVVGLGAVGMGAGLAGLQHYAGQPGVGLRLGARHRFDRHGSVRARPRTPGIT